MMTQLFTRFYFTSLALIFFALPLISALGQVAPPHDDFENFDVREVEAKPGKSADVRQTYRTRQVTGARAAAIAGTVKKMTAARETLAASVTNAQVELNRFGTAPELIGVKGAARFLTRDSAEPREKIAREFLSNRADLFGLTIQQASGLVKVADYTNPAGNISYVEFRHEIAGIPVFQGEIRAAFTAKGALARTTGNLAAGLDETLLPKKPELNAAQATAFAAASIGYNLDSAIFQVRSPVLPSSTPQSLSNTNDTKRFTRLAPGPFTREIATELFYFPLEPGVATLAYAMVLWEKVNAYYILVDAADGTLLFRKNITSHQSQTATYHIYNNDSPTPRSPTTATPGSGIQGTPISRTAITVISELPAFNNLGWITDGGNTTTGNNVDAGLDIDGSNGIDANGRAVGLPNRVFNFSYNPGGTAGEESPTNANYRLGAVANVFFWANRYHDLLYQLGFTEGAGNFQANNFGRGGFGSDPVRAEVQDSSGINNANFSTPPDSSFPFSPPRMQMYLFTGADPDRDTSLDQEIILHELTHGTSSRLHGNASGLTAPQAQGMGEGWSDFFARALLSSASEDVNAIYPIAAYSTLNYGALGTNNYYYGIRRFPYAVKTNIGGNGKPHNPLTFADIDPSQIDTRDGAFSENPLNWSRNGATQIHNMGEVWCLALLEMRARMIARLGYETGNQRAMQLVIDGMKLDPANPNFLQGRDAIITADEIGFGGEDVMDIRAGFAARGMGFNATTDGVNVTESFEVLGLFLDVMTVSEVGGNSNGAPDAGETISINVRLRNPFNGTDALNATATITGGGSANYGTITGGTTATQSISYTVPANAVCGSTLNLPTVIDSSFGTATLNLSLIIGAATTTYLSGNLNTFIPADASIIDIPIIVPDAGPVADVNVRVRLNHTFLGDVRIQLVAPDNTTVDVAFNHGNFDFPSSSYGNGLNDCSGGFAIFDDSATVRVGNNPPFVGTYRPDAPLGVLIGHEASGTWKLRILGGIAGTARRGTGVVGCVQLDLVRSISCAIACSFAAPLPNIVVNACTFQSVNFSLPSLTCGGNVTASPASGSFFSLGTTTVNVTGVPASGGANITNSFTVRIADIENPIITCPANVSVESTNGANAVVTFSTPTATDNCGTNALVFSSSPASGSTFPIGTTIVTHTARDAATNTTTCASTVTVTGCLYVMSPTSQNFPPAGGTANIAVTFSCGAWTATNNVDWITITSGAGGNGNGTVTFSVATNSGPARTGTLTIANRTFFVNQFAPEILAGCPMPMFGIAAASATGNRPNSSATGDFNGDGIPDLALTGQNPDNVAILLGNGAGGFGAPTLLNAGSTPSSVAVGDFNGDGKLDLAVVNTGSHNVSIFSDDGLGGFGPAINFSTGTSPRWIATADFNGDGKVDLAVPNGGNVSILLNTFAGVPGAAPSFSAPANFPVAVGPTFVAVGDVNGDGRADLVTVNRNAHNISVLIGNGGGGFGAASNFNVGSFPDSVVIGDFNGDFKSDLATANASSGNVSVLIGNGAGGFSAAVNYPVGFDPRSIVAADFNLDFKLDLAVANLNSGNVSVLLNTRGAEPTATPSFLAANNFAVGQSPVSAVVADFNNDGKTDIAAASFSGSVSFLANSCGISTDLGVLLVAPELAVRGTNLTYTITVTNHGAITANNVLVTDNLPAPLNFVSCAVTGNGVCGGSSANRTVTFATLAAGASETITLIASLDCAVNSGVALDNPVTIGSSVSDPVLGNNSSTRTSTTTHASVMISPTNETFTEIGGNGSVEVTSPCVGWNSTRNVSWITLTADNGFGNGTLDYSVAVNNTGAQRTGIITVFGIGPSQTLTVTQSASCVFSLDHSLTFFSASTNSGVVNVTAGAGCNWTATNNVPWITIDSGTNGSGNGSVNYSVAQNPGAQRTGTMTIAGQTFTVTQFECSYFLGSFEKGFAAASNSASVSVFAEGGCDWNAVANDGWITIISGANGNGNGTVQYSVAANPGPPRTGSMTIAGRNFTVRQGSVALLHLIVTTTNNSGAGSLHQAILDANANIGQTNTIQFNITGASTIRPASALPEISNPIVINGINRDSNRVVLNGTNAGFVYGLRIRAPNSAVRGLVVQSFYTGIYLDFGADNSVIENCYFGTDAAGTANMGNVSDGLSICSHNNRIGGSTPSTANIMAFNGYAGIGIYCGSNNVIQNNYIGTNPGGANMGNGFPGIEIDDSNNLIGGTTAGTGNTIAFNGGQGIVSYFGMGNVFRGNSIHSNTGLGIDLDGNGATANDAGDVDAGVNNRQNFPELTAASSSGGNTMILGTFNSLPANSYTLEFFANSSCDASGNGEGQTSLGLRIVFTDSSGNATINFTFPTNVAAGFAITATATDPAGNTSEFSACAIVSASSLFRIVAITRTAEGVVTITFASESGKNYRVEYVDNLAANAVWTPLQTNIVGTGTNISIIDNGTAGQPRRYYQVVLLP